MYLEKHSDLLSNTDWRTLIILDTARFDFFAKVIDMIDMDGDLIPVNSEAQCTAVWYKTHWPDRYEDIVLLSSSPNPFKDEVGSEFYISRMVKESITDNWNENDPYYWCEPQALIELYRNRRDRDKRYILHFLPPHIPFRGERGERFLDEEDLKLARGNRKEIEKWGREHDWRKIEGCYEENLLYALKHIEESFALFEEPVVITADHGQLIGERDKFGHFRGSDHPALSIVPWFENIEIKEGNER